MKSNIFSELDEFFMEKAYTEDQIAKFFLSPNEREYFRWQLDRYQKAYANKEVRVR